MASILNVDQIKNAAGTTAMTIDSSGNLILTNAGSSVFYQTGTWTPEYVPTSGSTTITYDAQTGNYTRIGNVVHFSIHLGTDSRSGGSGNVTINLPIASKTGITQSGSIGLAYSWGSSQIEQAKWYVVSNSSYLYFAKGTNSAPDTLFSYLATGANANRLFINGIYLVD